MYPFEKEIVLSEYKCPQTGQDLWDHGIDMMTYDGPVTLKTADGLYVYEMWSRSYDPILYVTRENGEEPVFPNKFTREKFFAMTEGGWKAYYNVYNTYVPVDHPMLDTYCTTIYTQYLVNSRLREIEREKWARESKATGFDNIAFPIVSRVFTNTVAQNLVSVQPLEMPKGLIFYTDYKFVGKKKQRLPKWLWEVKTYIEDMKGNKKTDFLYLADRWYQVSTYYLFGIKVWKRKAFCMS